MYGLTGLHTCLSACIIVAYNMLLHLVQINDDDDDDDDYDDDDGNGDDDQRFR